nr:arylesterase [Pseudovibrio hongkongensis]
MMASALPAVAEPVRIVAFGDSLTAGYQLPAEDAFPVQLEKALHVKGLEVTIINAGVSGDTTAAGLARLDWSVADGTDGVILALGANDALRGLDPRAAKVNLEKMINALRGRGIKVFLVGMMAPRNMGAEYVDAFDSMYSDLAKTYDLPLYPFFLEGVATDAKLNLGDGMHPTGEGVAVIVERMLPQIEAFSRSLSQ